MAPGPAVAAACKSAAAARMVEEQARTRSGFDALPGPFPADPPLFPSSWDPPPPPASYRPLHSGDAPPAHLSSAVLLSASDIAILRSRLPNLAGLSDDMFRHTPISPSAP